MLHAPCLPQPTATPTTLNRGRNLESHRGSQTLRGSKGLPQASCHHSFSLSTVRRTGDLERSNRTLGAQAQLRLSYYSRSAILQRLLEPHHKKPVPRSLCLGGSRVNNRGELRPRAAGIKIATAMDRSGEDMPSPSGSDTHNRPELVDAIRDGLGHCLVYTNLEGLVPQLTSKVQGKVRDIYDAGEHLVVVTTDRQSAFDRILAAVPFKGQVLNLTSQWWFNKSRHIVDNVCVCVPHPNVMIYTKCKVFPVEFVVRGYITGSTSTSLWTVYDKGIRNYCGNELPEGLVKNQPLDTPMLTPTTKAADHDEPVSPAEIVERGLMTQEEWDYVSKRALALFEFGQASAREHGLLLVDTKYEFGRTPDGRMVVLDEVHTPDSSRYWLAASYEERHAAGLEPENIDKEFLRLWFRKACDPYTAEVLPEAPPELVSELSRRYIQLYEMITGSTFIPSSPLSLDDANKQLGSTIAQALKEL